MIVLNENKLKSFTLMEMVIVLVLTAIVTGLAFSVLNLVQRHLSIINTNLQNQTEHQVLKQALWLDFNRFSEIEYDEKNSELNFFNVLDTITYKFEETGVVRDQDTFKINFNRRSFFFDGLDKEDGPIDAIKLSSVDDESGKSIFVYKLNDASTFLK